MDKIAMIIYLSFCLILGALSDPAEPLIWAIKAIGFALFGGVAFIYLTFVFKKNTY